MVFSFILLYKYEYWGHSWLGNYIWLSNGKNTFLDNFTCLVCFDLYCEAYFGSYLHFILHIEYTDKVNFEGVGSCKISFWNRETVANVGSWLRFTISGQIPNHLSGQGLLAALTNYSTVQNSIRRTSHLYAADTPRLTAYHSRSGQMQEEQGKNIPRIVI